MKAYLAAVREAPTLEDGKQAAVAPVAKFERLYPSAVRSLMDDLDASLAHLRLPAGHHE